MQNDKEVILRLLDIIKTEVCYINRRSDLVFQSSFAIDSLLTIANKMLNIVKNIDIIEEALASSEIEFTISDIFFRMDVKSYVEGALYVCYDIMDAYNIEGEENVTEYHHLETRPPAGMFIRKEVEVFNYRKKDLPDGMSKSIDFESLLEARSRAFNEVKEYCSECIRIVAFCYKRIRNYYEALDLDKLLKDTITTNYWEYYDDSLETLENDLYNDIYNLKIVNNTADEPECRHWGELLEIKLENLQNKVIKKVNNVKYPIDINNPEITKAIARLDNHFDLELLFREITEINLIKYKARPSMKRMMPPVPEEELAPPLPSCICEQIRDDNSMNWLFHETLDRIAINTGKKNCNRKWSHVKRFLEDRQLISVLEYETEFAKCITDINPEIGKEHVRTNVKNNEIKNKDNKKYWELPAVDAVRVICEEIEKEFMPLLIGMGILK